MYIDIVPNRNSPPAVLLREAWREGGKIKKRTLANLSHLDSHLIEHLRTVLRGGIAVSSPEELLHIERSLPHGHVAAVLGAARQCGLGKLLGAAPAPLRPVCLALIVARVIEPDSKLATWRQLNANTATHTLSRLLELEEVDLDTVYAALDALGEAQGRIERALARKHLANGVLLLYDVTSTWVTGRCCPLAEFGHSRDGKRDDPQIVFGLLCTAAGCPVAVEVFKGNTGDPATLQAQVAKLKERFGLTQLVWVGDRGMITSKRIEEVLRPAGMSWITALRAPDIQQLIEEQGAWQLSLFDERGLVEITQSQRYPGERLVVCRNPALAEERARKREELLKATEAELNKIAQASVRAGRRLKGKDRIGLRVGRIINRYKMAKHFELEIGEERFSFTRKQRQIDAEAALDGLYVLRTNVPADKLNEVQTVRSYKSLSNVERAFRSIKTLDLHVRPIFHYSEERVRAHVFLCMLAYYVEWHMRQALKPMLHDDEELCVQREANPNPVAPTARSAGAKRKDRTHHCEDGLPVHSLRTLLKDLATLNYNVASSPLNPKAKIILITQPTPLQAKAFSLLDVDPRRTQ